jgi:hypothetical protein
MHVSNNNINHQFLLLCKPAVSDQFARSCIHVGYASSMAWGKLPLENRCRVPLPPYYYHCFCYVLSIQHNQLVLYRPPQISVSLSRTPELVAASAGQRVREALLTLFPIEPWANNIFPSAHVSSPSPSPPTFFFFTFTPRASSLLPHKFLSLSHFRYFLRVTAVVSVLPRKNKPSRRLLSPQQLPRWPLPIPSTT